jgi:phage repressor protein C with HTH and peptisase S24 domain
MSKEMSQPEKDFANALGERVRTARGKLSREALSAALEVHVNTVSKFERGESMPGAFALMQIAAITGCSVHWLLTGRNVDGGVEKSLRAVERGEYVYVPHFDVKASAGNGIFNDIETVITMRPFDVTYIRGTLGITHNDLALITVIGTSMQPQLHSKDTVMLDLRANDVQTEGIHAIRIDGALLVKKVQRLPGKVLRVSSANTNYESFDIVGTEEVERDFSVVGRVRWGGVTFD